MMTDEEYYERIRQARKVVQPTTYVCYRATEPIVADGRLDAPSWKKAAVDGSIRSH